MPRVRGLLDIPEEAIQHGDLHEVAMPGRSEEVIHFQQSAEELVGELTTGNTIVNPEFVRHVESSKKHEVYPKKMIEESRSAHGVSFGRLVGQRADRQGEGTVLNVAMKPFKDPETAVNEMLGYQVLRYLGIETFHPVGVFPAKTHDKYIVMTEKRNDLMSLDRDEWIVGRRVESARDMEIAERNTRTVKEIAGVFALMHLGGVFHPDGQIKNFAITNFGKVGVIDTENLTTRDLLDSDTSSLAVNDIEKLVKSLLIDGTEDKIFGVGMLAHMPLGEVRKSCEELIINPYVEALMELTSEDDASPTLHKQAEELTNAVMHILEQDENWPGNIAGNNTSGSGSH